MAKSNHLKSETAEELQKQDFDGEEALQLLDSSDLAALEISRGQQKLLEKGIHDLKLQALIVSFSNLKVTAGWTRS